MAGDYGEIMLDKQIAKLSKTLDKEYKKAYKEMSKKANDYFKQFMADDKIKRKAYLAGEITKAEYDHWKLRHIQQTTAYNKLVKKLGDDLTKTDVIARQSITGALPQTFINMANYEACTIQRITGDPFTVYNRDAVARLAREKQLQLPPKMDIPKDQRWNVQRIHSAITQGILQGDSMDKMASRLLKVTNMNEAQAMRTARTMHTAVANEGRMDAMRRAEAMGADIARQWLSAHDERTRDAHLELDGVVKGLDEPFENEIGEIMYPADPSADPANVYNCRCALRRVINGHFYDGATKEAYEKWVNGD